MVPMVTEGSAPNFTRIQQYTPIDTIKLQKSVTPVDISNSDMKVRCLEPRDRCYKVLNLSSRAIDLQLLLVLNKKLRVCTQLCIRILNLVQQSEGAPFLSWDLRRDL